MLNVSIYRYNPDHVEEYASVCIAVGREDLIVKEEG